MTLPASGQISLSQVNTELGLVSTTTISMNQSNVRDLFDKPTPNSTISMSDGWGKTKKVQRTVFIVNTGTFTVPSNFVSLVSVEAIAPGRYTNYNSGGAGGGAYAKTTSITGLAANSTCYTQISQGNDAWFRLGTNAAPASSTQGVLAKIGAAMSSQTLGGEGGSAASSIGTTVYAGGNGGNGTGIVGRTGGGGGAAGPGGAGKNGGSTNNGGGGGAGGALSTDGGNGNSPPGAGGYGGSGPAGTGGGVQVAYGNGGSATANSGGGGAGGGLSFDYKGGGGAMYPVWTSTVNGATAGPGGGGGGAGSGNGGAGTGAAGDYGGGSGGGVAYPATGGLGIVVFTYLSLT